MIDFFAFLYDKITNELVLTIAIPIGLVLALIFSWDMGLQKTTFLAGKKLAPEIGGTGLQDAIIVLF